MSKEVDPGDALSDQRNQFIPNTFQKPNIIVDVYMPLLTSNEYVCLDYAIRRILGFGKRADRISLSQFVSGITTKEGKVLDGGTGLSKPAVMKALEGLTAFGLLVVIDPGAKNKGIAPEYGLQWDVKLVDLEGLIARREFKKKAGQKRTQRARIAVAGQSHLPAKTRSVPLTDPGKSDLLEPGQSHLPTIDQKEETQLRNPEGVNGKPLTQNEIRKLAENKFVELTGIKPVGVKNELGKRWWTPLRTICKIGEWNPERIMAIIEAAIAHAEKNGTAIYAPQSIIYCIGLVNKKLFVTPANGSTNGIYNPPENLPDDIVGKWASIPQDLKRYIIDNPSKVEALRAALGNRAS